MHNSVVVEATVNSIHVQSCTVFNKHTIVIQFNVLAVLLFAMSNAYISTR